MEQCEIKEIIDKSGYVITHSPKEITHAICTRHGKIVPVTADDHRCCWRKNLRRRKL
uniref:Uncharacterized protein n=1 Tax=viral metagenome TaxID=1070528 RepID=A0A6M3JWY1_9ZZZZ